MEKKMPLKKLSDGSWKVVIWKNKYKDGFTHSFVLKKSFKKGDEWVEQTINFFEQDLARCTKLLNETYSLMVNDKLKEIAEQ